MWQYNIENETLNTPLTIQKDRVLKKHNAHLTIIQPVEELSILSRTIPQELSPLRYNYYFNSIEIQIPHILEALK